MRYSPQPRKASTCVCVLNTHTQDKEWRLPPETYVRRLLLRSAGHNEIRRCHYNTYTCACPDVLSPPFHFLVRLKVSAELSEKYGPPITREDIVRLLHESPFNRCCFFFFFCLLFRFLLLFPFPHRIRGGVSFRIDPSN